ncbi:MAG TPA: DUF305 domain-containing protein [Meiothermus sp.]|nr:DUF305 domain-containing protein [Meiothermus sp.]
MRLPVLLLALLGPALACGFQAPKIWAMLWETPAPNFDRAFLSLMQNHYEETKNMGERFLGQISDPQLKSWTQTFVNDRKAVLKEIQAELSSLGGTDPKAVGVMKDEMASDWKGLQTGTRQGKASETYTGLMVTNGFSAIGMAQQALERSKNPKVLGLAKRIVAAESDRVEKLQIYLMGGR